MEASDDQITGDYTMCSCYSIQNLVKTNSIQNLVKTNISKNNILNLYLQHKCLDQSQQIFPWCKY